MPNILIIDDDDSVSRLLKTHLSDEGYNVSVVDHAEDGLALALKEPPDLIMLDVFLPDATGFQICSQFRKSPATKTTPIIMMTGAARFPSQQAFGRQRGANEYIFKPFKVLEVGELVHKYIGSKRTQVPPPKSVFEVPVSLPVRAPELEAPVSKLNSEESRKIDKVPESMGDNLDALSQFLKQTLRKQGVIEAEPETSTSETQFMNMLKMPEPVEPLPPAMIPASEPVEENPPPAVLIPPAPQETPAVSAAPIQLSALDTLLEISSMASRLSWLTMARKLNLLDTQGKSELKTTCQSLITLLGDFLNSEKSR